MRFRQASKTPIQSGSFATTAPSTSIVKIWGLFQRSDKPLRNEDSPNPCVIHHSCSAPVTAIMIIPDKVASNEGDELTEVTSHLLSVRCCSSMSCFTSLPDCSENVMSSVKRLPHMSPHHNFGAKNDDAASLVSQRNWGFLPRKGPPQPSEVGVHSSATTYHTQTLCYSCTMLSGRSLSAQTLPFFSRLCLQQRFLQLSTRPAGAFLSFSPLRVFGRSSLT